MAREASPEARLLVVEDEPNIRRAAVDEPAVRRVRGARARGRASALRLAETSGPTCSCST